MYQEFGAFHFARNYAVRATVLRYEAPGHTSYCLPIELHIMFGVGTVQRETLQMNVRSHHVSRAPNRPRV